MLPSAVKRGRFLPKAPEKEQTIDRVRGFQANDVTSYDIRPKHAYFGPHPTMTLRGVGISGKHTGIADVLFVTLALEELLSI